MIDLPMALATLALALALTGWFIEYSYRVRLQQERDNLRAELQWMKPKPHDQKAMWLN